MRSSRPISNEEPVSPTRNPVSSEDHEEIVLGSLLRRRLSRTSEKRPRPPTWYEIAAAEYRRRDSSKQAVGRKVDLQEPTDLRLPDQAHLSSSPAFNPAEYNSSIGELCIQQETDLEAGVLLTHREKKLWASVILSGSLTVCLICGLIAALAVR